MLNTSDLQQQIFTIIKKKLPVSASMVDEISEVLNIGHDSVYRRIRGEKEITLSELKLLCVRYSISLDQLLQLESDSIIFSSLAVNVEQIPFEKYLEGILKQLQFFNSFKNRKMYYLCKDVPIFYFYLFPEIAAFKSFFWTRTIMNQRGFEHRKFSLKDPDVIDFYQTGLKIMNEYNQMYSVELWNHESLHTTICQVEFYRDSGMFAIESDLHALLDSLIKMLDHLQLQADQGFKFLPGAGDVGYKSPIEFYINEIGGGSNIIFTQLDDLRLTFVSYSILQYMQTSDERFNKNIFASFEMLIKRSTLISSTGEKERNKFFDKLREKVNKCRL